MCACVHLLDFGVAGGEWSGSSTLRTRNKKEHSVIPMKGGKREDAVTAVSPPYLYWQRQVISGVEDLLFITRINNSTPLADIVLPVWSSLSTLPSRSSTSYFKPGMSNSSSSSSRSNYITLHHSLCPTYLQSEASEAGGRGDGGLCIVRSSSTTDTHYSLQQARPWTPTHRVDHRSL